jgi:hypothetical protein
VFGVRGLRAVDASAFPILPSRDSMGLYIRCRKGTAEDMFNGELPDVLAVPPETQIQATKRAEQN